LERYNASGYRGIGLGRSRGGGIRPPRLKGGPLSPVVDLERRLVVEAFLLLRVEDSNEEVYKIFLVLLDVSEVSGRNGLLLQQLRVPFAHGIFSRKANDKILDTRVAFPEDLTGMRPLSCIFESTQRSRRGTRVPGPYPSSTRLLRSSSASSLSSFSMAVFVRSPTTMGTWTVFGKVSSGSRIRLEEIRPVGACRWYRRLP
ncbi:hypothetical protein KCV06_g157, partial [Aureobasidium melanogenum]